MSTPMATPTEPDEASYNPNIGEHIADALENRGVTVDAAAAGTGIADLGALVAGRRDLTAADALRLARYFGTSAVFWMNLSVSSALRRAELELGEALEQVQPLPPVADPG